MTDTLFTTPHLPQSPKGGQATSIAAIPQPLKWHIDGGKAYLATRMVAMMPPHLHYVEPYAGGLSVMLAKDPTGVSEVANDRNGWLTNFWSVLREPRLFAELQRHLEACPFSESLFDAAAEVVHRSPLRPSEHLSAVSAAAWFFICCRQSMAGRLKSFAPLSRTRVRRAMNEQASAWITAIEGLPAVHKRLWPVVILNGEAVDVIRQQDGADTLFYIDPPYLHETRTSTATYGEFEMSPAQHRELLETLGTIKGKFILSGYDCPLYRAAEQLNGWHREEWELPNNAAGGDTKRRMTEVAWCNFEPGMNP